MSGVQRVLCVCARATAAHPSHSTAAKDWVRELKPYQDKGVKISSPQIVYDLDWMDKFMTKLHQLGADVDFMAIHSYTPKGDKGLNQLKTFVQKVRKRYGKR